MKHRSSPSLSSIEPSIVLYVGQHQHSKHKRLPLGMLSVCLDVELSKDGLVDGTIDATLIGNVAASNRLKLVLNLLTSCEGLSGHAQSVDRQLMDVTFG